MSYKYICKPEHAPTVDEWMRDRGGVAIWKAPDKGSWQADMWATPATEPSGRPALRPSLKAEPAPEVITDPAHVGVRSMAEVSRFHVAVRRNSSGEALRITDRYMAEVRRQLDEAGPGAICQFDPYSQEAVILVPKGEPQPLDAYMRRFRAQAN